MLLVMMMMVDLAGFYFSFSPLWVSRSLKVTVVRIWLCGPYSLSSEGGEGGILDHLSAEFQLGLLNSSRYISAAVGDVIGWET